MIKSKVLVVDDIAANRLLLSSMVEAMGYSYDTAKNGKQAIELIEVNPYGVVFLDIEMPVMNGFETLKHIREKFKPPLNKIPVIGLTAHNMDDLEANYKITGFDEFITKPYSIDKLEQILSKYFNQ